VSVLVGIDIGGVSVETPEGELVGVEEVVVGVHAASTRMKNMILKRVFIFSLSFV